MKANNMTPSTAVAASGVDAATEHEWLEVQRLAEAAQHPRLFAGLLAAVLALTVVVGAGAAVSGPRGSGLLAGALAPIRYLAVQVDASLTNR
ncbi:MAG: hypothetical protein HY902_19080 [Deltaproteobacteria bacterium]|nr:hypothetical protein [Deltaproteobacteria bacterium]